MKLPEKYMRNNNNIKDLFDAVQASELTLQGESRAKKSTTNPKNYIIIILNRSSISQPLNYTQANQKVLFHNLLHITY